MSETLEVSIDTLAEMVAEISDLRAALNEPVGAMTEAELRAAAKHGFVVKAHDALALLAKKDAEQKRAYDYLARVFRICAPQCEPFPYPDMIGLCIQIDHLIAGYRIRLGEMPTKETW